ncbi:unnamed protein product [Agarophyton chilense]|eukprot:gb/GEZJ01001212.1/.p1 GENE.gb/GEZJ01001212.1/~~gb/GEZJ01001212.1/.p1  ORF type:complete len:520 (-),score=46.63 gb/GEZJ01001212.1/:437-1996(-)
MSRLTLTIAALALCVLQAQAAVEYRYASSSPYRSHETAYTIIEVTIAPHTQAPRDSVRPSGLFRHSTPSPPVTPVPLIVQSPIVIVPHTEEPTKTPTPALHTHNVARAHVNSKSRLSFAGPPTVPIHSSPSFTLVPLPSGGTVSLSSVPAPSELIGSPSPHFVKRVIAIPLRLPTRRISRMSVSPLTNPIGVNQQPAMVLNSPFPLIPIPSPFIYMARGAAEEGLARAQSARLTSSSSPSSSHRVARDVHSTETEYELKYMDVIPPSAELVSPMPPRPSGTMRTEHTITVDIRLSKMLHASPLAMASASAAPSREPVIPEPLPPSVESDVRFNKAYVNTAAPSPIVSVNPHDVKDHIYTIAPSSGPIGAPMYDVRMIQRHRFPSIKVKKETTSPDETTKPTSSATVGIAPVDITPPIVNVSTSPTRTPDVYEKTARLSLETDTAEYNCDSVKRCMCVIVPYRLLSKSLRLYCELAKEQASSVCEQSKEAHNFLEFWGTMEGAEGLKILSKCAPDMLQLS